VRKDHLNKPVLPLIAYSLASFEPTYTVPSGPMAGDEWMAPFVVNIHMSAPVLLFSAYSFESNDPTYSTPLSPMDGDEPQIALPVRKLHFKAPVAPCRA
jgi:hypothetical protein